MDVFNKASTKDKRRDLRRRRTEAETALWQKLRARDLLGCKFFRQYGIGEYIADFYCPQRKLVIEIEGGHHQSNEHREYDKSREDYMNALDIKTLRFSNSEVLNNMKAVLARIESELELSLDIPLFAKEREGLPPSRRRGTACRAPAHIPSDRRLDCRVILPYDIDYGMIPRNDRVRRRVICHP